MRVASGGVLFGEEVVAPHPGPEGGKTLTARQEDRPCICSGPPDGSSRSRRSPSAAPAGRRRSQRRQVGRSRSRTGRPSSRRGPLIRCSSSWMIRSGGPQRRASRPAARGGRAAPASPGAWSAVLELRRAVAVARCSGRLTGAEQRLRWLAFPRHLGELVDRRDQERRQQAVDLLVDHQHWQPLARRRGGRLKGHAAQSDRPQYIRVRARPWA